MTDEPTGTTRCYCDNCDWTGTQDDVSESGPLFIGIRLDPGSEVPAGDCPDCGAFAYVVTPETTQRRAAPDLVRALRLVASNAAVMQGGLRAIDAETVMAALAKAGAD